MLIETNMKPEDVHLQKNKTRQKDLIAQQFIFSNIALKNRSFAMTLTVSNK